MLKKSAKRKIAKFLFEFISLFFGKSFDLEYEEKFRNCIYKKLHIFLSFDVSEEMAELAESGCTRFLTLTPKLGPGSERPNTSAENIEMKALKYSPRRPKKKGPK